MHTKALNKVTRLQRLCPSAGPGAPFSVTRVKIMVMSFFFFFKVEFIFNYAHECGEVRTHECKGVRGQKKVLGPSELKF